MADRSVVYRLRADVTQFRAQMATAASSVKDAADKMTAADKSGTKFRTGLASVGKVAGGIGLAAGAGLVYAIKKAADFDQGMSRIQAATHETSGNMERLRAAALKAGADTVFSATESADAITAMAKAGVKTKDILSGGLTGALNLASAGELDVAQAADIAATTMNQFGLKGKDVSHIADVLAAAAGKAQGEVSDMAEALKFVGPVAAQMGVSLEETTGTIAELASKGILGSQAGESLRGMLLALTSPSHLAAKTMQQLGISVYDAHGKFVGFNGVAQQMHKAMSGLTAAERDQAFGRIFGNAQVTTARILYAGGARDVNKWTHAVNDSGYAAKTAATKLDNLKGDLEKLRGSLETALIGTGSGAQGPLRSLVQDLTKVVDAYNRLPPSAQGAVSKTLAATAALGGGVYVFSKLVQGVANTRIALSNLGVSAASARTALLGLGKGVEFAAIIAGLDALDSKMQQVFHENVDTSDLGRSLTALGERGKVAGTLADTFGGSLTKFGKYAADATDGVLKFSDALFSWEPGDTTFDIATRNIKQLDTALAGMVEGGQVDAAKGSFNALAQAARKQGVSMSDLHKLFPQYNTALGNTAAASHKGAAASGALGGSLQRTGGQASQSAKRVSDLRGQIQQLRSKIVKAMEEGASPSSKRVRDLRAQIAVLRGKIVDIGANTGGARAQLAALNNYIAAVTRNRTVNVSIQRHVTGGIGNLVGANADGGTIPGARYPYGDKVLRMVAPGEEVISNRYGQADRYRTLLKAINAGRGYADGGTVARAAAAPRVSIGGTTVRVFVGDREMRDLVVEELNDRATVANRLVMAGAA